MSTIADIREKIANSNASTAWKKGVRDYAEDLFDHYVRDYKHLEETAELQEPVTEKDLLNGAQDWNEYSYGGCALVDDSEICETMCTPHDQIRYDYGNSPFRRGEEWLSVQARALRAASGLVMRIANKCVVR